MADLNVAFLDGSQPHDHQGLQDQDQLEGQGQGQGQVPVVSRHMFTRADVDHLRQKVEAMEGEVDLLLTCQWPAGITQGLESYGTTAGEYSTIKLSTFPYPPIPPFPFPSLALDPPLNP